MSASPVPDAPPPFAGKVALVTGAASGIGAATARLLARGGASVLLVDVDAAAGAKVAREVDGRFVDADVSSSRDWAAAVSAAVRECGGVDLVHLNAGVVTRPSPFRLADVTDAQYERIVGVNLGGVFFGMRALLPVLESRGGGAIVVTSSLAGIAPNPLDPLYAATKHAVVAIVRSVAPLVRDAGITVNAVCPAAVDTAILDHANRRRLAAAQPQPIMRPEEVAAVVADLLAGTATGQVLAVLAGRGGVPYEPAPLPS